MLVTFCHITYVMKWSPTSQIGHQLLKIDTSQIVSNICQQHLRSHFSGTVESPQSQSYLLELNLSPTIPSPMFYYIQKLFPTFFVTNIIFASRFMFENVHDHQCIYSVIKLNFENFQAGK